MSLLTVVEDAADRLGIVRPTSAIGSADPQARQLVGLAQQEGKELARRHPWQVLQTEKTFTATATEAQTGAIPEDFDRWINSTFYNRTLNRRLEGPLNSREWQSYKASVSTVLFDAFRQRGDSLLLAPTPTAGDSYAYEYVSTFWVRTAGGTAGTLAAFVSDTDVAVLSEELVTDGVVWRFLKAKGFDYSEAFRTYEAQLMLAMTKDGGARNVNMSGAQDWRRPRAPNWPDGSWSLT